MSEAVHLQPCRFLPMRYTSEDAWGRDGDNFYSGCVVDEAFGPIPAGEYRSVFVSLSTMCVMAVTPDGLCYETDFTLTPRG